MRKTALAKDRILTNAFVNQTFKTTVLNSDTSAHFSIIFPILSIW